MLCKTAWFTVRVAQPGPVQATLPNCAVMVAAPVEIAVAVPLWSTVATLTGLLDHVRAKAVRSCVAPA